MKTKSTIIAFLLLASGAATAAPSASLAPPKGSGQALPGAGPGWSNELRASVRRQCEAVGPDQEFCACLARELEILSPDPYSEFTSDQIDTGLADCQNERVQQVEHL